MNSIPASVLQDEERLGELAMRFRGTRNEDERAEIAENYLQSVERLIHSGRWDEMPPPEDQLPDTWMPKMFFEYWSKRPGVI